jgi:hypothetical protein
LGEVLSKKSLDKAIEKGKGLADEWCGAWCKPIHVILAEFGTPAILASDSTATEAEIRAVITCAHNIIHKITESPRKSALTGRSRIVMAASALYLASVLTKHKVCQRDLAHYFNVTDPAISETYRVIVKALNLDVSKGVGNFVC